MPRIPISYFQARLSAMVSLLQTLVEHESPTTHKQAVDRLGQFVVDEMRRLGAEVECHPQSKVGDHWVGRWGRGENGILLMGHLDTVYPLGTLDSMPWMERKGSLKGPGVLDMKSGFAIALTAIEALHQESAMPPIRLTLLCNSDEETGSATSRPLIEHLAKQHDLVLCLEPGLPDGSLKTWRKGTGSFQIKAHGKASHAGSEPQLGVNAILEVIHQIRALIPLEDHDQGTTLNVGIIRGGTRSNVIPDYCYAKVDARVETAQEQARLSAAMQNLEPKLQGAALEVLGGWNRPPMPRNSLMRKTFQRAHHIASRLGIQLTEGGTGGGSDANFIAPLGIPVLDGLGAIGVGAHSENETVERESLPRRAALIAALITDWHAQEPAPNP